MERGGALGQRPEGVQEDAGKGRLELTRGGSSESESGAGGGEGGSGSWPGSRSCCRLGPGSQRALPGGTVCH